MKTNDREPIVVGRVYYRVMGNPNGLIPYLIRVKAATVDEKRSWPGPVSSFEPGYHFLTPAETRGTVFKSFDKAKAKAMRIAKAVQKDLDAEMGELSATTKKQLMFGKGKSD